LLSLRLFVVAAAAVHMTEQLTARPVSRWKTHLEMRAGARGTSRVDGPLRAFAVKRDLTHDA